MLLATWRPSATAKIHCDASNWLFLPFCSPQDYRMTQNLSLPRLPGGVKTHTGSQSVRRNMQSAVERHRICNKRLYFYDMIAAGRPFCHKTRLPCNRARNVVGYPL